MFSKLHSCFILNIVVLSMTLSSVIHAAEIEKQENPAQRSRMIEEVIVTAQKRAENVQDVPISIQAFGNEKLDALGVESTADLPRITPGLTVTTQVGYTVTYLRGLGSDAFLFADPSVVNYTDGVYYPFPLGQTTNFGDIERVEVLKGPQGTLFGRNAIGGAVSIYTKDPSLEEVELTLRAASQSYNTQTARGSVSVPLIEDSLAASLSGIYFKGDGHIKGTKNTDNGTGGEPLDQEVTKAYRGKIVWAPTDWVSVHVNKYHLDQHGTGTLYAVNVNPSQLGETAGIQAEDPYRGVNNEDIFFDQTVDTLYGNVEFNADWFDLKLFGSDQKIDVNQNYDFDGSIQPLVYFEVQPASSDVQTAELQVLSNDSTWGSEWLEWIVGAYYFKSEAGFEKLILRAASTNLSQGLIYGMPLVSPDVVQAVQQLNLPSPTGDIETVSMLGTDSMSYYAQATVDFWSSWSLTLGGRYQEEEREVLRSAAGLRNLDGSLTIYNDQSAKTDPSLKDTTTAFSPKVTLNYHPSFNWLRGDGLIYATWQKATKSATFNVINFADFTPEKVLPEKIEAYEIGFKSSLLDGLVNFNASAFDYTIKNPQVQIVSVLEGGVVNFENAGEAQSKGIDFDLLVQLFPKHVRELVLTLNGCYLDAEYTDYKNGTGFNAETGILESGQDFSGSKAVRSPEFSGTVSLTKTFGTGWGPLEVSADYYYNDGFYYTPNNIPSSFEKDYGVLGARISYLIESWDLRISGYGRNLTDAEYNYSRFVTDFGSLDARAPLANYGISLEYNFSY